jgi:hypothetical protein
MLEVRRPGRGPLLVHGEDEPPAAFAWPWPAAYAEVIDAFGQTQPVEVHDGRVRLRVSLTPLFRNGRLTRRWKLHSRWSFFP